MPLRWVVRLLGALVALGADLGGRLGLDQGLEHELHALADDVDVTAGADRVEQFVQVRLVMVTGCLLG